MVKCKFLLRTAIALFAGVITTRVAFAQKPSNSDTGSVRLVVLVVVDQMRDDYLSRFSALYSGGLKRLMDKGTVFTRAYHDHAVTETAVGHATISTGCYPSQHGIVGNTWYDQVLKKSVPSVSDTNMPMIGGSGGKGASPRNLLRPTVGDWLKKVSPQSKIVSIALKDRAAILMGGIRPDCVYWNDRYSAEFVTSSYYAKAISTPVSEFNREQFPEKYRAGGWSQLLPDSVYALSHADSFPAENDGVNITFPHQFTTTTSSTDYGATFWGTPFGDQFTLNLASQIAKEMLLGKDNIPDMLWISCSAADVIGHLYGPNSQEIQDYYTRLDQYLDTLLTTLDADIGRDKYSVILTADHGVMTFPEDLAQQGIVGSRITLDSVKRATLTAGDTAATKLGLSKNPIVRCDYEIILDYTESRENGLDDTTVQNVVADHVRKLPFIADLFTAHELAHGADSTRRFSSLFRHSYHETRRPDIFVNYPEYCLVDNNLHGTSHGTPYEYDRHIVLVIAGSGFEKGTDSTLVYSVDIAPTIARMLGIPVPGDLDGKAIDLQSEK